MGTFGKCYMCPNDSRNVPLYGSGVCYHHLHNPVVKREKTEKKELPLSEEKLLNLFYTQQWKLLPGNCENCGGTIFPPKTLGQAKFHICHIIPKKNFKSVMVHPHNTWFGCNDCHTKIDRDWETVSIVEYRKD